MFRRVFAVAALTVLPSFASGVVEVRQLNPFDRNVKLPDDADLSTIRFEQVKLVKVATQSKLVSDTRYCEEASRRDPGGSIRCSSAELKSPTPAYEVTYSYRGQAMASDELGSNRFTFSIYFRPDDLSPAVRKMLAGHKVNKSEAAALFQVTTSRPPVEEVVTNKAASKFCEGNYVDGDWVRRDPNCKDQLVATTITAPSPFVMVKVIPVSSPTASNR